MDGEIKPWENALIHVNSLGHATVSSIYEGIKGYWNAREQQLYLFRLDDHLKRFLSSVKIVRLNLNSALLHQTADRSTFSPQCRFGKRCHSN
jgi:branched-chain amino acid aminotransferase